MLLFGGLLSDGDEEEGARRCCSTLVFLYDSGEGVWARLSFIVHMWVCHVCYLSIASHVDAFSFCLVVPFFVDLFFLNICSFVNFNRAFKKNLID